MVYKINNENIPFWAIQLSQSLLQNVKQKDVYTFEHCCRVGRSAKRLAKAMGLSKYDQHRLEFVGLFHDIGKVGIPDAVLLKKSSLNDEEYKKIIEHPLKSVEIIKPLTNVPFFRSLMPGVRYHHERIDGKGYPFTLRGERIPLAARIVAVVDAVDAMLNSRPYQEGHSWDYVVDELRAFSGKQFDARIVKIYLEGAQVWPSIKKVDNNEFVVKHIMDKAA